MKTEFDKFIDLALKYEHFESSLKLSSALNLFHYTSPVGLLGILDHSDGIHLHFTRMDCLNDLSEGKLLSEHYDAVCKKLLKEDQITELHYNEIINLDLQDTRAFLFRINNTSNFKLVKYTSYLCCFSSDQDSLPMWRYYSKNNRDQGYNIKFCSHVFEKFFSREALETRGHELELYKIKYSTEENKELISKIILDFKPYILNPEFNSIAKTVIRNYLTRLKFQYKSHHFQSENEIRAILYVPEEIPIEATAYARYAVKYKNREGLIVPYIDVLLERKSWVVGATIGPLVDHTLAKQLLYTFLKDKGYNRCELQDIQTSQVPIRY